MDVSPMTHDQGENELSTDTGSECRDHEWAVRMKKGQHHNFDGYSEWRHKDLTRRRKRMCWTCVNQGHRAFVSSKKCKKEAPDFTQTEKGKSDTKSWEV